MAIDTKQILRDGTVDLTSTETNPAATRNQGPISLATGLPRKGVWFKAYFKGTFTAQSAVNLLHASASPTGGTFGLTLGNQSLANTSQAYNVSAATLQAALVGLATKTSPLVINGVAYTSLTGGTDITVSGTYNAGDVTITFGGKLANQPIVVTLDSSQLTGGSGYTVTADGTSTSKVGSQIDIQPTDGTNVLPFHIYLDGAVPAYKEVAVLLETGHSRLYAGQPMTKINYKATVSGGTITAAPVVIYVDDTMGGMN